MAVSLSISNPNPRRLQGPSLLHELVPLSSQEGAPAIDHTDVDGNRITLSYSQFHDRANALARLIISKLERRNNDRLIIPLLIPQCPELYISQLATLKAGGAFCPIVLDAPEERLRFILQDISAKILLTTAAHKSQLPHLEGVEILVVDEDCSSDLNRHEDLSVTITPQDAAYIMYTSGSTGQPKGVILSHSAATQALLAHDLHIPKFSRFLQFASPTFDVSVFEIFFPWLRSCTLVSCDRRRLLNDLPAAISDLSIDACELTPSVASSLLQGRNSVPSLKVLLTIGEMLKPSVVEEFGGSDEMPAILHGMYGPTEATIHCTLQIHFPKDMSCGAIGIPLDTVSAFIVKIPDESNGTSPTLEILPMGEEGELAVGGYQLADGYLNRDEKTREAFVEHPDHGMLYRTGDRARMSADGKMECLGRISSGQVKLRGQVSQIMCASALLDES
jgi:amino acid adenylation domain-containing protein